MRWVKETLPPRALARWLLITVRLSQSSLTGTERTDVAVGTVSEVSMFATVRAGAPLSTVYVGSSLAAGASGVGDSLGTGDVVPLAGSAALASGRGVALGSGLPSVFGCGCFSGSDAACFFDSGGFSAFGSCFGSAAALCWAPPLVLDSDLRAPLPV